MPPTPTPPGPGNAIGASPWALPGACVLVAIDAALGYGYQKLVMVNPAAIANPLITAALVFAVGAVAVFYVRLCKVRGGALGMVVGCVGAGVVVGASFAALGSPIFEAWGQRWIRGITLLPRRWTPGSGWRWPTAIVEALLILFGACAGYVESMRPFCTSCGTWARATRWRLTMPSPPEAALTTIRRAPSVPAVVSLRPGAGPGQLIASVGACRCGAIATLHVIWKPPSESNEIKRDVVEDLKVGVASLEQVLAWGEGIDARLKDRRPTLRIATRPPARPLGATPTPEGGRWVLKVRQVPRGQTLGIVSSTDNAYTAEVRRRLVAGDYAVAEEALRAQRHPDDMAVVAHACADFPSDIPFLLGWERDQPNNPAFNLVRGINLVLDAWRTRGGGMAIKDPAGVVRRTGEALTHLHRAAELAPRDPTSWAWMMQAAKTTLEGRSLMERCFAEVVARAPRHRLAHTIMLDGLMEKWYGSDDEMLEFARARAAQAPPGSSLAVLIPWAHLEKSGAILRAGNRAGEREYLASRAVADEIRAAYQRCFREGTLRETMDAPYTREVFAFMLWRSGSLDEAGELLKQMNNVTSDFWFAPAFLPFVGVSIVRARRACRSPALRARPALAAPPA